ncbi:MAG: AbgT family transporter [Bacteroidaceae bacterium]|nr:AbgT family transporter [Bacteroidaceae bacterium]
MNKKTANYRPFYYPAVAYMGMLLLVWLLSWVVELFELAFGKNVAIHSLVSAEGLRWAVRTAKHAIDAVPWSVIMLFLFSVGLLTGSGMFKSICKIIKRRPLAYNEQRAWLFALIAAAVYMFLLFICTLSPWNILLGVSGNVYASPLVQGYIIICFFALFFVTSTFGFIYGNYRSFIDIARSLGAVIATYAPALVALLPAAGIVPCMDYAGLLALLRISPADAAVVSDVIYMFPFLYMMLALGTRPRSME